MTAIVRDRQRCHRTRPTQGGTVSLRPSCLLLAEVLVEGGQVA
jgi:hypothetical protein